MYITQNKTSRSGKLKIQLLDEIRKSGLNTRLPGENVLARQFGVCRATVNKIMVELEREGYVRRYPGKGTFVMPLDNISGLSELSPAGSTRGRVIIAYSDFFSYSIWEGVHMAELLALKNNYKLIPLKMQPDSDLKSLEMLLETHDDVVGAILLAAESFADSALLQRLSRFGIPLVVNAVPVPCGENVFFVGTDHKNSGFLKTECLLRNGHRRIGYVANEPLTEAGREHIRGVKQALYSYGVNWKDLRRSELNVKLWDSPLLAGYHLTLDLTAKYPLTALLVDTLPGALGALRGLYERGLKCPDDISIVTSQTLFGVEAMTCPALTTVCHSMEQIIGQAFAIIGNPGGAGRISNYAPLLIERESVKNIN